MNGFKIERATSEDTARVLVFLKELYLELGEEKESLDFLSPQLLDTIIRSECTKVYLAKHEAQFIGVFTVTESQAIYSGGKYGVIDEMYILPEFRGRKYGEEVLKFITQLAREANWKRVDVTAPTEEKWQRTRRFYEKNGFIFTGPKYKFKL